MQGWDEQGRRGRPMGYPLLLSLVLPVRSCLLGGRRHEAVVTPTYVARIINSNDKSVVWCGDMPGNGSARPFWEARTSRDFSSHRRTCLVRGSHSGGWCHLLHTPRLPRCRTATTCSDNRTVPLPSVPVNRSFGRFQW